MSVGGRSAHGVAVGVWAVGFGWSSMARSPPLRGRTRSSQPNPPVSSPRPLAWRFCLLVCSLNLLCLWLNACVCVNCIHCPRAHTRAPPHIDRSIILTLHLGRAWASRARDRPARAGLFLWSWRLDMCTCRLSPQSPAASLPPHTHTYTPAPSPQHHQQRLDHARSSPSRRRRRRWYVPRGSRG